MLYAFIITVILWICTSTYTYAVIRRHNIVFGNNNWPISNHNINPLADGSIQFAKNVPFNAYKPVNEQYPSAVLFGRTCGGTIISPTWVLSAAHCTLFTGGRDVLAGTNNTENGSGVRRRVKRLIIHPKFTVGPYWVDAEQYGIKQVGARWDFLLAELEQPLPLDGTIIAAARLDDRLEIPAGEDVGYAGYGAELHGETMREDMHGMDLQILDSKNCTDLIEYDPQDMICTIGRPPKYDSACNGDSGSGLMSGGTLVGVASWVEEDAITCRKKARVIFSRVGAVRDWIRQYTKI